jgi:hypothetical protein
MKRNLLLLLLFFIQQGYSQSNPYFISAGAARSINDFYGLNGQNTLDPNSCYADNDVRTQILKAQPSYLRYPGGEVANYWDWQEGWFYRNMEDKGVMSLDMDFQSKIRLTSVFNGSIPRTFGGNFIADFKATLAHTGTKPLFVLNPLTSDKYYQIAMLLEAKLQNLNVKRVEIGNEFYLSKAAYMDKFPSAADYASTYLDFRSTIKDYLGTDVQVCAVASNKNDDGGTSDRSETWNSGLASTLGGNVDSYTIHQYRAATSDVSSINYHSIFSRVNNDINELDNRVSQLGLTAPIWITEYNLFDKNQPVHGTWFHALYDSYLTLKFLENQRIEACNLHAQSGNYVFGSFYNVTDGLKPWGDFPGIGVSCNTTTSINKPTSVGIAMEFIAKSLMGASSVRKLEIGNSPTALNLDDGNSPIYAIYISKGSDNELLILNLSDQIISSFNTSVTGLQLNGFGSNVMMNQISYSNPTEYASGITDEFNNCVGYNGTLTRTSMAFPTSQIISLPAYSLTRVYRLNAQRTRQVYAQKDTITAGTYTTLVALDNEGYNVHWSTGSDSTQITVNPASDITYTATYTPKDTSNHSVEIVTKLIKVLAPLTVSINASSLIYCAGSAPIHLNTSVTGGTGTKKYIWITAAANEHSKYFNQGIGTLSNIFVSPEEDTRYIVYVTDGKQVAKAEIVITNPGAIKMKPEYIICTSTSAGANSNSIELEQTAQANVAYTYQINGGTSNIISTVVNEPIVITSIQGSTSSSQGTITINSNYASNTCISSASAILTQYECCSESNFVIPPGSNLNDLRAVLGTLAIVMNTHKLVVNCNNANSISFNGDFHVFDSEGQSSSHNIINEIDFENCELFFSEGASIKVEPGYTLAIDGVTMDASCQKMWKGIILDNASLLVETNGSSSSNVLNAEFGVNSLCGSRLKVRRCNFIDNIVGINSNKLSANGNNFQFITYIKANEFYSTADFRKHTPYFNMQTNRGDRGMAGIRLKNVVANIGNSSIGTRCNYFHDLNAGVLAYNSALSFTNNVFENIMPDVTYNSQSNGPAISNIDMGGFAMTLVDGYFNPTGLPLTVTKTMNNCEIGVESINTELSVKNCGMAEMKKGVFAANTFGRSINIAENNIKASSLCIDLLGNDYAKSILVKLNTLEAEDIQNGTAKGIQAWEINQRSGGVNNSFSILCNYIDVKHGTKGIELGNVDYVNVAENSVLQNEPNIPGLAYHFINSNFGIVGNNQSYFDAELHAFEMNSGFMFENSQRFEITHNYAYNCHYGFDFLGNCSAADFNQNRMENHFTGLHLNAFTTIDPQPNKGNMWYGNFNSGFGAENDSWNNNQVVSWFYVNPIQGIIYNPILPPNQLGWFQPSPILPIFPTPIFACAEAENNRLFNIESSDLLTMQAIALDPIFNTESLTNASKYLFEKFSENDSVLYSSSAFLSFYDSLAIKSLGKLSSIRMNLTAKNIFSRTIVQSNASDSIILGLRNQLLMSNDIDNFEEKNICNAFNRVVEFNVDNEQILHVYLDSLSLANENIISNDIVNENEKALNKITAKHKLKCFDNYSPLEISTVTSIAMQCPREGGASVYRAREIMISINPNLTYNDDGQCNVLLTRKANSIVNNKNDLGFVADKSNGDLKFINKSNTSLNCMLFVYDALGRELLHRSLNLNQGVYSMPFDNNNGVYFAKLLDGNSLLNNFKFIW